MLSSSVAYLCNFGAVSGNFGVDDAGLAYFTTRLTTLCPDTLLRGYLLVPIDMLQRWYQPTNWIFA